MIAWLVLAGLAHADPGRPLLAELRRKHPVASFAAMDLEKLREALTLRVLLAHKFPEEESGREAVREADRIRAHLREEAARLEAKLPALESGFRAALDRAKALAGRLRHELRAGGGKGACVALDYGGAASLYEVVVVRVERRSAGFSRARLVYRAKEADATGVPEAWERFLASARAWEVPDDVLAGGRAVPCRRADELVRAFRRAQAAARPSAPVRERLAEVRELLSLR